MTPVPQEFLVGLSVVEGNNGMRSAELRTGEQQRVVVLWPSFDPIQDSTSARVDVRPRAASVSVGYDRLVLGVEQRLGRFVA